MIKFTLWKISGIPGAKIICISLIMVDEISSQKEFVKISKRVSLKTILDILIIVQQFTLINSIILLYISVNGLASIEFLGKVVNVNGSNSNEFFVIFFI